MNGAEFFAITGGVPNQQNIDPRWRWLLKHEAAIVERTAHLCGSYDFIVYRLTGQFSLEENWAAESGLYDIRERRWHHTYLERAAINPAILPPVRQPTETVGSVTAEVVQQTGLRAGTPVVAGSADHIAAALAAGLTQHGDILLKFGGAGDILYCSDVAEPDEHFYFDYHDIPGLTIISGCMATSGSLVKWFARELAGGASLAARGVFAGVMLHHTRAHLYRAVLEAVCYGFAHHLALLQQAGRPIRRIYAADGGSRSSLWMQIAADITGRPVQVVAGEAASALGTAFVGAMGIGMFTDWHEIARFISQGPVYYPQAAASERYRAGLALYRDLYQRLKTFLPAPGRSFS